MSGINDPFVLLLYDILILIEYFVIQSKVKINTLCKTPDQSCKWQMP